MSKCKTCGKKCDGEYCFQHKPRKKMMPARVVSLSGAAKEIHNEVIDDQIRIRRDFFIEIWKKRPHKSEISGTSLGSEPLHIFFHHILSKEKYPEAELDEENIILLTLWEHADVESDIYKFDEVNKRREQLKQKYEIN